jgi:segregation and condensation protein A
MKQPAAFAEGTFMVELDRFQGPLDLLLHLIREQDIDVFDIPIGQITEQFLRVVMDVEPLGLDRAGEFLEMAATLVRIKAQMLLPRRVGAEGELEDPRTELVRRLLEYEYFREASLRLAEAESDRARRYARGHVPGRAAPQPVAELQVAWEEVFGAALALVTRVEFRRLVEPFGDKLHGVVTFLAGLELAKRRQLAMRQSAPFAEVWLYRRKDAETDAAGTDH